MPASFDALPLTLDGAAGDVGICTSREQRDTSYGGLARAVGGWSMTGR